MILIYEYENKDPWEVSEVLNQNIRQIIRELFNTSERTGWLKFRYHHPQEDKMDVYIRTEDIKTIQVIEDGES